MSSLTIEISDELHRQLDELSRKKALTVSEYVSDTLRRQIAIDRFQALRKETVPYADAQGFRTDEDVFEAIS